MSIYKNLLAPALATTGEWTKKLIPDIAIWTNRRYGNVNYHFTQFLLGHGSFGEYLHGFKRSDTDQGQLCVHGADNVEHAVFKLFKCDAWYVIRRELEAYLGKKISPENVIGLMLSSKEYWDKIEATVIKILKTREKVEREKEKAGRAR